MKQIVALPKGVQVLERGWLSSNTILLGGDLRGAVIVDTGYCTHAEQTSALIAHAIARDKPAPSTARLIVNTHLHSDHCGGNARLQQDHGCPIWVPAGDFEAATSWDEEVLSYRPTGQQCVRFRPDAGLRPGDRIEQANLEWHVHAAPGHDPSSIVLFEPESRTLISADALWERGFGIVFPELDGSAGFTEVKDTLDLIERLAPACVIPGHGSPFRDVQTALSKARARLCYFQQYPERHALHAAKALIMFHMMAKQEQSRAALLEWLHQTPVHRQLHQRFFDTLELSVWSSNLIAELVTASKLHQTADGDLRAGA